MKVKVVVTMLITGLLCASGIGEEESSYRYEEDNLYRFEMQHFPVRNGNKPDSVLRLVTPRKTVELDISSAGMGLGPLTSAVMIPQKGFWDGELGIFSSAQNLSQGQRSTLAAAAAGGGLVTTSMSLRVKFRADKRKKADPVETVEKSDLFPALQAEFGAQKARDLLFARMVEGWSFRKIAEKYFQEPLRSRAVRMANEEYEALAADKSRFGRTLAEQEAVIDAKVGQIVLMRIALEQATDPEAKAVFQETLNYLRTEHRNRGDSDAVWVPRGNAEAAVHAN